MPRIVNHRGGCALKILLTCRLPGSVIFALEVFSLFVIRGILMQFFGTGLFWFVQGILFCLALWGLRIWMQDKQVPMPWWKWVLVLIWIGFTGLSIAFVGTSLAEGEARAAYLGGLLATVIAVIGAVVIGRILRWR